jgi:hypothetical protein
MNVEIRRFSDVLRAAVAGDPDFMEAMLSRYMPLFNNQSLADGKFDEDMRQYILMRVIMMMPKFSPDADK